MQHWIEIKSDGVPYMVDQNKVSLVTDIHRYTFKTNFATRWFMGMKDYHTYKFSFKLDGTRETIVSDTYEEAKEQQLLLLGVRNGTSNS